MPRILAEQGGFMAVTLIFVIGCITSFSANFISPVLGLIASALWGAVSAMLMTSHSELKREMIAGGLFLTAGVLIGDIVGILIRIDLPQSLKWIALSCIAYTLGGAIVCSPLKRLTWFT